MSEEKKNESKGSVSQLKSDKHDMDIVRLTVEKGESSSVVEIYLHGAHVTNWYETKQKKQSQPFFFLSKDAKLDGSKAIRGGIPICFPQFSNFGDIKTGHGFARISSWAVDEEKADNNSATVTLKLAPTKVTRDMWPNGGSNFEVLYTVTLEGAENSKLSFIWQVKNTGKDTFSFTGALHTYFQISDIGNVDVSNLSGLKYMDQVDQRKEKIFEAEKIQFTKETDSVYYSTPDRLILKDSGWGREFEIIKKGMPDAVIWNPWIAKAKRMSDFGNDEYKNMVCVEAAAIENPVSVEANKTWTAELTITPGKLTQTTTAKIPTVTRSRQVGNIHANIDTIWEAVKGGTFDWQKIVTNCEVETEDEKTKSLMEVGSTRKLTYGPDNETHQVIQITEISEKSKRICWQMVTSEPAVSYTSREDSLRLIEVTHPTNDQTVIEWISDFSNDASIEVIVDSDMKKKEAFGNLQEKFGKKK